MTKISAKHCSEAWKKQPPIEYIVDDMIEEGTLTVFYGDGGSGKTYISLVLAACVSAGIPFLNCGTKKQVVLYVDEEMGERMLERRIRYVCKGLGIGPEQMDLFYISMNGFNFSRLEDANDLKKLTNTLGIQFVIIDAMSDTMEGDENSKKDVQIYFNNLKQFKQENICLFILHHTVKDLSNYRGSTAIKANSDNLIHLDSTSEKDNFSMKFPKTRDGKLTDIQGMKTWGEGNAFSIELGNIPPSEQLILKILGNKQISLQDLVSKASDKGIAESTAKKAIYSLASKNRIMRINPSDNPRIEAIYTIKTPVDFLMEICENPPEIEE